MSKFRTQVLALGLSLFAAAAMASAIAPPPPTDTGTTTDMVQGVSVADPYRWLETTGDPKVQAWSEAQNARTRIYLDALPNRAGIQMKLIKFVITTSPTYAQLVAKGPYIFAIYVDATKHPPVLVTLNADADPASQKILLQPNEDDDAGLIAIDWFEPSPDGSKVAVSLSRNGTEDGTLHVYDVATAKEIGAPIPRVQYPTAGGSLAWAANGNGFWYTRFPGSEVAEADRHFNEQVYFHKLGSDWKSDPLALGTKDGLESISEVFLDNRNSLAPVLASVQRGDGGAWAHYVLREDAPPVQVATYADKIVFATLGPDGALYGISRADALNGKIVKQEPPFATEALAHGKIIVPGSDVAIFSGGAEQHRLDLTVSPTRLFVRDIVGGSNQVRMFDLDGHALGGLPLPDMASNTEIEPLANGDVLFDVSTYFHPRTYMRWVAASGKTEKTLLRVVSPVSFADTEIVHTFATSKDGTKVPINIFMRRGTELDGNNPTLLYGYGGYGISMTPGFLGPMYRLWLDAGGIYVIADIRGGAEYGERWHQEGMLTNKQNSFDDFVASAQYLIDQNYTAHDRLALIGGSNGGLLMGAMLTQHPQLARAVVSEVGLYDMVRAELNPNGSFNATEYGTVKDAAQFKALYAYSPYHHVTANTSYPAVLMMTGATDGRVDPMNSRKFTAALQAATNSGYPILLRTSPNSGHGLGSSLSERVIEQIDQLAFLYHQLGMSWRSASRW
jgi:prolyl oligopeptidase